MTAPRGNMGDKADALGVPVAADAVRRAQCGEEVGRDEQVEAPWRSRKGVQDCDPSQGPGQGAAAMIDEERRYDAYRSATFHAAQKVTGIGESCRRAADRIPDLAPRRLIRVLQKLLACLDETAEAELPSCCEYR